MARPASGCPFVLVDQATQNRPTRDAFLAGLCPGGGSVAVGEGHGRGAVVDRCNGVSPQPDEPCRGRLPVLGQAHAGTRGQSADRRHSLRLDMLTKTRSAYAQVRCAVVALWSEHHPRYARQI
jgi:hypothetical protein